MQYRTLGKTGFRVSEISLGTWQVGGGWGAPFDDRTADEILNRAIDLGVNFIDTADGYADGYSEAAVGRVVKSRRERVYVATKCGRRIHPHVAAGYTLKALEGFVDDSLRNTGLETLDLIQLHCPPTEVYYRPEIFGLFERLKAQGKIQNLGVSVEKVEEGIKALQYPNVASVQIIFNMFRQRPSELFFSLAKACNVGIIVRVPLASGLLSGKMTPQTTFAPDDHRAFNREGAAFDRGETFAGVDFERGLAAADALKALFPEQPGLATRGLAAWALRWVLMFDAVSCVIPGASRVGHVESNVAASALPPLTAEQMAGVERIYAEYVKDAVHERW